MHIEFINIQTGQNEKQEVIACFQLGFLTEPVGCEERMGFCLGLQMPHKSTLESETFWNKIHGPWIKDMKIPIAYFCNENCRIPFYTFDGNGYDESYDSSCLFAYVNPFLFASEEKPKMIKGKEELGAYIMGFYDGPDRSNFK